ncbi:MAG: glutamine amidotransferase, partial [Ruminococcaceae bacterium]|nr:glutamine amidotransferase [Oscillospiraceae bacterium]
FLAIGTGFQLLGSTYVSGEGEIREGLNLLPISTERCDTRFVGNIATEIDGITCVGFENHAGRTRIGDMMPLGRVLSGFGNNGEDAGEGLLYKNTFCTFLHGPLLSKNPELADKILLRALRRRYTVEEFAPIDDAYALCARDDMLKKMHI